MWVIPGRYFNLATKPFDFDYPSLSLKVFKTESSSSYLSLIAFLCLQSQFISSLTFLYHCISQTIYIFVISNFIISLLLDDMTVLLKNLHDNITLKDILLESS